MSERELHAFETRVLGPAHAREHAMQRRKLRIDGAPERSSVRTAAAAVGDPAEVGRWGVPFGIPVMAVHAAVLPTGKVLWFSYPQNPAPRHGGLGPAAPNTAQAWLWNPVTGASARVDPPLWRDPADGVLKPANIWCSGQTNLADGRLLVTGGNLAYSTETAAFKGLNKVYTFNPFNETWTEQPDMRQGRWYPTNVLLPDGRAVIASGYNESGDYATNDNRDVELFTPSADLNGRGTLTLLGSRGGAGQPPTGGLYPHMIVLPSGRTLTAGPYPTDTWFLNAPGTNNVFSWGDAPNMARDRLWGTAVLVPGGPGGSTRVMELGGSAPPTVGSTTTDIAVPTSEVFDEANPGLGWQAGASMNVGRGHHNTVLLPDGSMVTVGGGVGIRDGDQWAADPEQRQIELWNPSTGSWTLGPAQAESRAYHSIAMLLPDGRVISAGDDVNGGTDRDTAEIYEPPYLFKGTRPTIAAAPPSVQLGSSFDVDTPNTNITRAALVAPSATTHANDMSQRYIPLTVTQRTGGVRLTAPANPNIAPPELLHALPTQQPRRPLNRQIHPRVRRRCAFGPAARLRAFHHAASAEPSDFDAPDGGAHAFAVLRQPPRPQGAGEGVWALLPQPHPSATALQSIEPIGRVLFRVLGVPKAPARPGREAAPVLPRRGEYYQDGADDLPLRPSREPPLRGAPPCTCQAHRPLVSRL